MTRDNRKLLFKSIIYVFLWFLVSMTSSFEDLLDWDWNFINGDDAAAKFLDKVLTPMLIWGFAFSVDYVYSMLNYDESKFKERKLCKIIVYCFSAITLAVLVIALHYQVYACIRWGVLVYFMIMLFTLKFISLYSLESRRRSRIKQAYVKPLS